MKHSTVRNLGIAILCFGLVLLGVVFYQAYVMLTHPVPGLSAALAPGIKGPSTTALTGAGAAVTTFLLHLLTLFIMTIAASQFAALGIRWSASHTHSSEAPATPIGAASESAPAP